MHQGEMKPDLADPDDDDRGDQLKYDPGQPFTQYDIPLADRGGIISFQNQLRPETEEQEGDSENSRAQQRKTQHSRKDEIDYGIGATRDQRQLVDHQRPVLRI